MKKKLTAKKMYEVRVTSGETYRFFVSATGEAEARRKALKLNLNFADGIDYLDGNPKIDSINEVMEATDTDEEG